MNDEIKRKVRESKKRKNREKFKRFTLHTLSFEHKL